MNINKINEEYRANKKHYGLVKSKIIKNIDGRIPHHKIVVLAIICNLFEVNNYLEIGVHNGASMSYVLSSKNKVNCFGVDLFEETIEVYKKRDNLQEKKSFDNIKKNNVHGGNITFIKGNSFHKETIEEVETQLNGDKLDLLFIDGDHSYEGVKSDFDNYQNFVKSGGLIVFDDYLHKDISNFCDEKIDKNKFKFIGVFEKNELILEKK